MQKNDNIDLDEAAIVAPAGICRKFAPPAPPASKIGTYAALACVRFALAFISASSASPFPLLLRLKEPTPGIAECSP